MFIAMKPHATQADFDAVVEKVRSLGLTPHPISGTERRVVAVVGNTGAVDPDDFGMLPGVAEALRVSQPFKLVSREVKEEGTVIDVGGVQIGGRAITVMAGPCSVESREQILETAHAVKAAGARILRGGAWKPRTSPYEFQGLREEGLKLLALAREETGLQVITEVMSTDTVDLVAELRRHPPGGGAQHAELRAAGAARPGAQAGHAEARPLRDHQGVAHGGRVHRGRRATRTSCSASGASAPSRPPPATPSTSTPSRCVKSLSHLPVIVDPSHGIGIRKHVAAIARAGIAAGADGIMVEVHPRPEKALSDGHQSLAIPEFAELMREVRVIALAIERPVM